MSRVDLDQLTTLQADTGQIRNFCILAHVDHGKTTLSDSLVSSNGIFSPRLAGKLRFLDSTEEEQKRGITMHSSAISLLYRLEKPGGGAPPPPPPPEQQQDLPQQPPQPAAEAAEEFLINLVDSPGHIDFSSDVSTATRLCDGALVLVDVLEGMCTQTHAVLYKALKERMRPCLVLNKIDRLALEMQLSPVEAFHHLRRIVENANALAYSLVVSELRSEEAEADAASTSASAAAQVTELDSPLLEEWTFAPEKGNVIFASALDCWGFGLAKFANLWSKKTCLRTTPSAPRRRRLCVATRATQAADPCSPQWCWSRFGNSTAPPSRRPTRKRLQRWRSAAWRWSYRPERSTNESRALHYRP